MKSSRDAGLADDKNDSEAVTATKSHGATEKTALSPGMRLIVGVKLAQGIALGAIGLVLLQLNARSADVQVGHWLERFQVDTDTKLIRHFLHTLDSSHPHQWKHLGAAAFLYAVIVSIEGSGLWLQKPWAEVLTVFVTASFIPLELYEVAKHPKIGTLVVMALNVAVVWYLANNLAIKRREEKAASQVVEREIGEET